MKTRIHTLLVAAGLFATAAHAQTGHGWSGGAIGGAATYTLVGPAGDAYVHLPSFDQGPTPLAPLFPGSPLALELGLDLAAYAQVGVLSGGAQDVSYPLPANAGLVGLGLNAQFLTLDLPSLAPGELSERVTFSIGAPQTSHFVLGAAVPGLARASVIAPRLEHAVALLDDGRVLVTGGMTPDSDDLANASYAALATTELFDPQQETFVAGPSMTQPRTGHTMTRLADGRFLLVGGVADPSTGVASATAEIYDPVADTFTATSPMNVARVAHTATLLADGRVFVAGGLGNSQVGAWEDPDWLTMTETTELYDPATDAWSPGPSFFQAPLPGVSEVSPTCMNAASLLASGKVLLTGGVRTTQFPGVYAPTFSWYAHVYDPSAVTILTYNMVSYFDPPSLALHAQVTLTDGRILIAGGAAHGVGSPDAVAQTYLFDESSGWTVAGDLNVARVRPQLIEHDGYVYALGGLDPLDFGSLGSGSPIQTIERAEIGPTLTWEIVGTTLLPRPHTRSVLVNGERILTIGVGANGTGGTPGDTVDRSAELYTP